MHLVDLPKSNPENEQCEENRPLCLNLVYLLYTNSTNDLKITLTLYDAEEWTMAASEVSTLRIYEGKALRCY